jgi:hypothetical protein
MMSAARPAYGLSDVTVANERPSLASGVLSLLILVIGLAVATVWYVVVPALDKPAVAERTCEVIVLRSGSSKCVPRSTLASRAEPKKPEPARRANR